MRSGLLAILFAASITAGTFTFGTGVPGTLEGNSITGDNDVPTWTPPAWHAPIGSSIWESIQAHTLLPPIPVGTVVDFWFQFGGGDSGQVSILVDDAARVLLNGHVLADSLNSPEAEHCVVDRPNCTEPLTLNMSPYLLPNGTNQLDVVAEQEYRFTFGVDVFGVVDPQPGPILTPEPGSLLLIAVGLLCLAAIQVRRSRSVVL
jgi:hypothetical protein